MKERLEDFVAANRDEFDDQKVPASVWSQVEKDLPMHKKKMKLFNLFSLQQLAAAVTVTAVGLAIFLVIENRKLENTISENSGKIENNGSNVQALDPEYAKEIDQFTRIIQIKSSELSVLKEENPSLYNEFIEHVKQLTTEYDELQKQLATTPKKDELLEAMLQNLRLQTELLNEQLTISKQIKRSKTKSHENATQTI